MRITVKQAAEACGGRLLCGDGEALVTSVETDSRRAQPGTLFVPICGERVDAHQFLNDVFARGAAASLTQEHDQAQGPGALIRVENTQEALQRLAAWYRSGFSLPVVGITGSVGKTTTKEMVALALSAGLSVMKTEGNQNSQVGLPLTMFRLSPEYQAAVIEMGMSNFGEMSRLAAIAAPKFAVMTNIGISHIEQLKTQKNIRSEKLHITDRFGPDSVLFLNGDDPLLAELKEAPPCRCVFFGTAQWCDYRASRIVSDGRSSAFQLDAPGGSLQMTLPVPGLHNVLNALAAVAAAEQLGVAKELSAGALAAYKPPAMRQQLREKDGITVIDDSYNASPDSVKSSLEVLSSGNNPGRKIAVLADMLELGDFSRQAHFDVGVRAAKAGTDLLVTVGERGKIIAEGARSAGETAVFSFGENREAIEFLHKTLKAGDTVLVKGSRGMKTDEIVRAILQEA